MLSAKRLLNRSEFYNKNFEASDVRKSIVSAVSIKVMEPVFESQTKTKLGSTEMGGKLPTVRTFINDFIKTHLDNFLHKNPETAEKCFAKSCKQSVNAKSFRYTKIGPNEPKGQFTQ